MITIVVPVFNGFEALCACLASLSQCPDTPVVLVDDASTDSRIRPLLASFRARRVGVTVLESPVNRGFAATANAGAAISGNSDILFLNSDTELTSRALPELEDAFDRAGAAVAIPMSNNAAFLSVPRYVEGGPLPTGMSREDMAEVVAECARDYWMELPTAIGFCMLVRRNAWQEFGPLDVAYGRGYCEDDDLAQRIRAGGQRVVCAPRAFVYHRGHASFGRSEQLTEERRRNGALLVSRWPSYPSTVAQFSRQNPFRPMLERVWDRVLSWPERRQEHVLHIVAEWPGDNGAEILRGARATRATQNHTIVVPTQDRGAWIDAIDGPTEIGIRWVGLLNASLHLEHFIDASPCTEVRSHSGDWPITKARLRE